MSWPGAAGSALERMASVSPAPSERESIGVGEIVPAKRPSTKTNSWYCKGRHMPSYWARPRTTCTPHPAR